MEGIAFVAFFALLVFLVVVALSRWIFRINHIVGKLDCIIMELRRRDGDIPKREIQEVHTEQAVPYMQ